MHELIVILFIIAALLIVISYFNRSDNFCMPVSSTLCRSDLDCGNDSFCFQGTCWGYWKGNSIPWINCNNPYCGSSDPGLTCAMDRNKCLPYCKCNTVRSPGGSIASECMPKCGSACARNDECPQGCPQCRNGVCSAPSRGDYIL